MFDGIKLIFIAVEYCITVLYVVILYYYIKKHHQFSALSSQYKQLKTVPKQQMSLHSKFSRIKITFST